MAQISYQNEDFIREYLKTEKAMSDYDIEDFINVYRTLSIAEVSELIYEMVGKDIYREYPVDIHTFIHDPYYLGTIYHDTIFKIWDNLLQEIYPAPLCKAYEEVILSTATRCFGKGFKVLMYDGTTKNVEDITVGDVIMGPDNQPRNVLRTVSGTDEMYKITPFKSGNSFICNKEHELALKVIRDHKKPSYFIQMPVKDYINESEYKKKNNYRLYHSGAIEYEKKDLLLDPYIFGTWLGDGFTEGFQLITCDNEIKEAWEDYANQLPDDFKFNIREESKNKENAQTAYRIWIGLDKEVVGTNTKDKNIYRQYLRNISKEFGHKRIPIEYLTSSIDDRRALLAGIVDTDGYHNTNVYIDDKGIRHEKHGNLCVTTKYGDLAEDYATLARSLGYRATVKERNKRINYGDKRIYTSYDVHITCNIQELPIRLARKQDVRVSTRDLSTTKFTVESIGAGTYYGFTVDKDNLFLGADYIVHKNCGKSTCIAISFAYEIYLMLCMINPAKTIIGKTSGSLVYGVLSKDNATAVGQVASDIYKILTLSPFFQGRVGSDLPFSNVEKKGMAITENILLKAGSSLATIVGTDLIVSCLDEANIGTNKIAADKLIETRLQLHQHAIDRRKATTDKAPGMTGIIWITSSPTEEHDVIKARIDQVTMNDIPNVKIVDNIARWEARGTNATEAFDFFIGSDTKDPCLLEDVPDLILTPEEIAEKIIHVPRTTEYLTSFRTEPIRAIQEIAGLRTQAENAFFRSVAPFEKVFYKDNHIFMQDELKLTLNGNLNFEDYMFDKDYFKHPDKPDCHRYIHLDIASKQDRFGMASVYADKVEARAEDGTVITKKMYFVDFCLGLCSQSGDAVDIIKALDFLYKIKKQGYPIKLITCDSHQGELAQQYLRKVSNKTVNTEYQSVEKTKDAYFNLKNLILTESLIGFRNPLLTKELKDLREDAKRVQKPQNSGNYSDDMCDALAGALFSCSQDKYYKKTNDTVTDLINNFKAQQSWNQYCGRNEYNF